MHYNNHAGFCRRGWYQGNSVEESAIAIVRDHCPFLDNYSTYFKVEFTDYSIPWINVRIYSPEKNCGYNHDPEYWFTSKVLLGSESDCHLCAGTGFRFLSDSFYIEREDCYRCLGVGKK